MFLRSITTFSSHGLSRVTFLKFSRPLFTKKKSITNKMKDVLKYILCFAGIILAVLAIYFGSYAPLHKAQLYIDALRQTSSVSTVKQFEDLFDPVFNFYSPIGNEEVPKFLSSDIVGILNSNRVGSEA